VFFVAFVCLVLLVFALVVVGLFTDFQPDREISD
jgi:hypothetical protein